MPSISSALAAARTALALMQEGRNALRAVVDGVRDGQMALQPNEIGELNEMLANEQRETEAAHNQLARAIEVARSL